MLTPSPETQNQRATGSVTLATPNAESKDWELAEGEVVAQFMAVAFTFGTERGTERWGVTPSPLIWAERKLRQRSFGTTGRSSPMRPDRQKR
ncbi:MAG: hypothetical protein ACO2PK_08125 [Armatimonadota bacterium]